MHHPHYLHCTGGALSARHLPPLAGPLAAPARECPATSTTVDLLTSAAAPNTSPARETLLVKTQRPLPFPSTLKTCSLAGSLHHHACPRRHPQRRSFRVSVCLCGVMLLTAPWRRPLAGARRARRSPARVLFQPRAALHEALPNRVLQGRERARARSLRPGGLGAAGAQVRRDRPLSDGLVVTPRSSPLSPTAHTHSRPSRTYAVNVKMGVTKDTVKAGERGGVSGLADSAVCREITRQAGTSGALGQRLGGCRRLAARACAHHPPPRLQAGTRFTPNTKTTQHHTPLT